MLPMIMAAFIVTAQTDISSRDFPKDAAPVGINQEDHQAIIEAIQSYMHELEQSIDLPVCPVSSEEYWMACV